MATNVQDIESLLQKVKDEEEEKSTLQKIIITEEIFAKIQKGLSDTIESIGKNPSIFSRAAVLWGSLPLWQQILGGLALTLPTLVIGLVVPIGIVTGILLAICGVTTLIYAAGGILLSDHNNCNTSIIDSLKEGVLSLANLLEQTIRALDTIRQELGVEVDRFVEENERLAENVDDLHDEVSRLGNEVSSATEALAALRAVKDGLEQASQSLKSKIEEQTLLLENSQRTLAQITVDYGSNQAELANKIIEFNKIKVALGEELNNAHLFVQTLSALAAKQSEAMLDDEQLAAYKARLADFLANGESIDRLVDRIFDAEKKLAVTEIKLAETTDQYKKLVDSHETVMEKVYAYEEFVFERKQSGTNNLTAPLGRHGLFAGNASNPLQDDHKQHLTANPMAQIN